MHRRLIYLGYFVVIFNFVHANVAVSQDADLVGWWKFDEGYGDVTFDSSGNGYDGTINGDPQWSPGIIGQALEFDGVDDYVVVTRMVGTDFTLMAWIKTDQAGDAVEGDYPATGGDGLFFAGVLGGATNNDFILALIDTQLVFGVGNSALGPSNQDVVTGEWVHIALTRTAETGEVSIYIDGVLDMSDVLDNTNPLTQNPSITFGANTIHLHYYEGFMDDIRIYESVLTSEEIRNIVSDVISYSSKPEPADGATYVPKNVTLSWKPGVLADKHDIYFGAVLDDVSNASRTNQLGVLAIEGQDANNYDPGVLEYGQTYYWRVDEVNAPPSSTIFQGDVWSFTLEPVLHPVPGENITATASTQAEGQGPENTINRSGLDIDDLHANSSSAMWFSEPSNPGLVWIQFDFDKVYELHAMLVWNYNGPLFLSRYGFKDVIIEYSTDGAGWTQLENVPEFAQATGTNGYAANTTVDFGGVIIESVRITANSNWGTSTIYNKYGLSEVLFLAIPNDTRQPNPRNGARNIAFDPTLSWIAGREAAEHDMYFSSDRQAVVDGTTEVVTLNQTSYGPLSLDPGKRYYWRVDEVNNAEIASIWQGSIWNFSTQEYLVVDNFESYNDTDIGQEGSNLIYYTWIDGYDNPSTNGSTIGYNEAFQPTMETEIVHRGNQSVPLLYDNTVAGISEVTANTNDLSIRSDWASFSPESLSLWFYGDPNNATTEQMYIKLNGNKVVYDGDPNDLIQENWQQWDIDLAASGIILNNVTDISIGFERTEATGGFGRIFIDDIQLLVPLNEQAILEQQVMLE